MAGRPRKPTVLKVVAGTDQPCRTNKKEPKPKRSIPSPPACLSDKAKTAWGAVSVILDRMGVLTEADGAALEGLCGAWSDLRDARASLAKPLLLKGGNGEPDHVVAEAGERYYWKFSQDGSPMRRPRPELADIADADRRFAAWLAKFGLTPADRSRVAGGEGDDSVDPWAGF